MNEWIWKTFSTNFGLYKDLLLSPYFWFSFHVWVGQPSLMGNSICMKGIDSNKGNLLRVGRRRFEAPRSSLLRLFDAFGNQTLITSLFLLKRKIITSLFTGLPKPKGVKNSHSGPLLCRPASSFHPVQKYHF